MSGWGGGTIVVVDISINTPLKNNNAPVAW